MSVIEKLERLVMQSWNTYQCSLFFFSDDIVFFFSDEIVQCNYDIYYLFVQELDQYRIQ